ncbi:helix-turn-helix domain-containing protein [Fusicatenibacter saccharivorans]|uniref:helix-turn-helix domain-containing protein n=1 Tax=Fusicatenibacter saccharivorans TaxID=1150298 RepID=UPI003F8A8334
MRLNRYSLKLELIKRDLTQCELARKCNLSRATISNILCGRSCKTETAVIIAKALDVDVTELIEK